MIRSLFMVEIHAADWDAAVAWYRDGLGLTVDHIDSANRFALLRAPAGRIALKQGTPQPGNVRLIFEVDRLDAFLERLAEHGARPTGEIRHSDEGYRMALFRDPNGHELGFFEWLRQ